MTPANIVTAIPPSRASVVAAFLLFGCLNAGTPLLIASTPVSAVQPDENARRTRNISPSPANVPVVLIMYPAVSACRCWPMASRTPPQMIISMTTPMKQYVGMAKPVPDSRTPRRFRTAIAATVTAAMSVTRELSAGNAEARLATPDETETATVSV